MQLLLFDPFDAPFCPYIKLTGPLLQTELVLHDRRRVKLFFVQDSLRNNNNTAALLSRAVHAGSQSVADYRFLINCLCSRLRICRVLWSTEPL